VEAISGRPPAGDEAISLVGSGVMMGPAEPHGVVGEELNRFRVFWERLVATVDLPEPSLSLILAMVCRKAFHSRPSGGSGGTSIPKGNTSLGMGQSKVSQLEYLERLGRTATC
jgi:hypothetical protein